MKILFRITVILLVAVLVAAGLQMTIENTGLLTNGNSSQPAGMQATGSQSLAQPPAHSEGGPGEGSSSMQRGLSDLLGALGKIAIITAAIVGIQGLLTRLRRRPLRLAIS